MPTARPRTHAVMAADSFAALFDDARLARFASLADLSGPIHIADVSDPAVADALAEAEVVVTSWGAPRFDEELLARMPRLRAVFHAAGSVRTLVSDALWEREILVTSAAEANAVPVAEFTLATILLSGKRAFAHVHTPVDDPTLWNGLRPAQTLGNLDRTVGIVGYSRIGRRVVDLLRPFDGLRVLVADPFADPDVVAAAGAELVSLEDLLPAVDVLSLHAPDLPATHHMIGEVELSALRDGATLINTARGALVDHDALLAHCRSGRIDAVLDVTEPEPLPADSPLRALPNVAVTPHIAGSLGTELRRLTDTALDELARYAEGAPARHPVSREHLATTA